MLKLSKSKKLIFLISFVALIALALAGYFYYQLYMSKKDPQIAIQKETAQIIAKVSKLIVLPEDEDPTIATVSDPEILKEQAFFVQAKKGDKVLIYTNAKKAILYSVSLNKVLEVAPLNTGDTGSKITPVPVNTPDTAGE
ncbi:MAG: hypothetical protein KBB54_04050 [Candidatus Pacebacteria bacterium]|jgi:flagellar basal body-associated protein FliL|nr:hypothetical protein [Candidatus Paceibacterota bacterium]